jgi:hypothetical protein
MDSEETERGFVNAGWEVPGPTRYPIVCNDGHLSMVAHEQYARSDDPVFEIVAGRCVLSYWVRVIISPRQAAVLLEECDGPLEEERGNSHKRW